MLEFWRSVSGCVTVEMVCADPGQALQRITDAGICVTNARQEELFCVRFSVARADLNLCRNIAEKRGYSLKIKHFDGLYWILKSLCKRPVLSVGFAAILALSLYIPSRVYFIAVEGNQTVPTRLILEKCAQCGIGFGVSRREVRSERVKNALLEAIPELQWVGVNTRGCVAVVSVRQRTDEDHADGDDLVSSIVATRDGIVTGITVTGGNALCAVGQAVRQGQRLISGYLDCGICIKTESAKGEVYALTQRDLAVMMPLCWTRQTCEGSSEKKFALIIGKKRINFYNCSGISGGSCDKMYSEYYVTLTGDYILPLRFVVECCESVKETPVKIPEEDAAGIISEYAENYLLQHMVAGVVLKKNEHTLAGDDCICLEGNYACEELISQARTEEIVKPNGNYE